MKVLRLSRSRVLLFCLIAGLGPALAAAPARAQKAIPVDELIANMTAAQQGLREWSARTRIEIRIGSVTVPVGMEIFCQRPDRVALKFVGAIIRPPGGFLLPDPVWFTRSPDYELQVTGVTATRDAILYTLTARPKERSQMLSWEFTIHGATWLITRATAAQGNQSSSLQITYKRAGEQAWVPETIRGNGILLLKDALPAAVLKLVSDMAGSAGVSYTVSFSAHQVNQGLPAKLFRP